MKPQRRYEGLTPHDQKLLDIFLPCISSSAQLFGALFICRWIAGERFYVATPEAISLHAALAIPKRDTKQTTNTGSIRHAR